MENPEVFTWNLSIPNFCKKDGKGQRNVIRLEYDAFSVAKVFEKAAKKNSFGKYAGIHLEYEAQTFCKKDCYLNRRIEFDCSAFIVAWLKYFAKLIAWIGFSNYCGTNCLMKIS